MFTDLNVAIAEISTLNGFNPELTLAVPVVKVIEDYADDLSPEEFAQEYDYAIENWQDPLAIVNGEWHVFFEVR